ncbi:NAD(P)-dependent oxidoreductase [Streptomyces sp. CB02923]|uniref:dTDP-4-dehydrorhamnose reductase n=1 Tax=Streptomyces sp. CB02923 TaxID=1718985 RepID=UPI000938FBED|nr:dTDP-4-dehydrorhamnose reductase [Streptomyces sp. CB02923]OKI09988.1 NAD(P)-dependent oxidoreductase [Streptomyces sp. CB02923]
MNRWLITGASGMLGREVGRLLAAEGECALPLDRASLDLTDTRAVEAALLRVRPAVVVNCAAYTDVDGAESHEEQARRINADAVHGLARACARSGARLLHLSTDYVFAGDATTPYTEGAPTGPHTAYGRSKLAGEQAVLAELPHTGTVVRTAWLYGAHGRNFVRTMAGRAARGATVNVVDDQSGQPTPARDVAGRLLALGRGPARPGVFHATTGGLTTWYGLAREVYRLAGADPDLVRPTDSTTLDRPARRPAWSVLGHDRWAAAGLPAPRHWRDALAAEYAAVTATLEGAASCAR